MFKKLIFTLLNSCKINLIKSYCLDLFFPKSCFGCQKQGTFLCDDCKSCLEISQYQYCLCSKPKLFSGKCRQCKTKKLDTLYFSVSYQKPFVKKLIQCFKYKPFIKELSQPLASLIIEHFYLLNEPPIFFTHKPSNLSSFVLVPIPLYVKRLKWRGFNQAEEIAKELSRFLNIFLFSNCLIKIKKTLPQIELNHEQRKENIKDAFFVKNHELVKNKKILLVDDVYTSGSTMEEAAKILKRAGAKEVIGIVVARG